MTTSDISAIIDRRCRQFSVKRLDLFGSRSRGDSKQASDYDFLVEFFEEEPAAYARSYFGLLHALEDDLKHPVDLLTPAAIRRPTLKRRIERDRIRLYEG